MTPDQQHDLIVEMHRYREARAEAEDALCLDHDVDRLAWRPAKATVLAPVAGLLIVGVAVWWLT